MKGIAIVKLGMMLSIVISSVGYASGAQPGADALAALINARPAGQHPVQDRMTVKALRAADYSRQTLGGELPQFSAQESIFFAATAGMEPPVDEEIIQVQMVDEAGLKGPKVAPAYVQRVLSMENGGKRWSGCWQVPPSLNDGIGQRRGEGGWRCR